MPERCNIAGVTQPSGIRHVRFRLNTTLSQQKFQMKFWYVLMRSLLATTVNTRGVSVVADPLVFFATV
ncbi:hypothetical protein PG988_009789 [Apiospora saccharicola]